MVLITAHVWVWSWTNSNKPPCAYLRQEELRIHTAGYSSTDVTHGLNLHSVVTQVKQTRGNSLASDIWNSDSTCSQSVTVWGIRRDCALQVPSLTSAAFFSACSSFSCASFSDSEYLSSSSSTPFSFFCRPSSSSSSYTTNTHTHTMSGWFSLIFDIYNCTVK